MKEYKIVAKARGIVILNGVAYTPNQTIPSPLNENDYNAIKDNIIIEKVEPIGEEPTITAEQKDNKPKAKKEKLVEAKKDTQPVKEEKLEQENALDELFA